MSAAIVFDLDDTLYPERRFALSGYAAVARHLEATAGVPAAAAFAAMARSLRRGRRRTVFQDLAVDLGMAAARTGEWLAVYRGHEPRLRLPAASARTLASLRPGWRLGVLTNGLPSVQRAKVRALALRPLVDDVVYAEEHGTRRGKPDPAVFIEILLRLGAEPGRSVFVGDDAAADIAGARAAGMTTVLNTAWRAADGTEAGADGTIGSLAELPDAILALAGEDTHVR